MDPGYLTSLRLRPAGRWARVRALPGGPAPGPPPPDCLGFPAVPTSGSGGPAPTGTLHAPEEARLQSASCSSRGPARPAFPENGPGSPGAAPYGPQAAAEASDGGVVPEGLRACGAGRRAVCP